EKAANPDGSDISTRETVARQALELRRIAADQAGQAAQRRIDAALAAQRLVDIAATAMADHEKREVAAVAARTPNANASANEKDAGEQLRRLDLLESAFEASTAEEQVAAAKTSLEQQASLRGQLEAGIRQREELASLRAAISVPGASSLVLMRRLENDLAGAR